jgi:hypothetical protein
MNRLFLAATVALTVGLFAETAAAQSDADRERARAEFDRGVAAYTAENFQGALEAFQEAYRLRPHPTVRVNMANCYDHLNRPIEAIFHYEHYLTESGRGAPAEQRREVEDALRRLRARVGDVTLRVAPDGAMVVIDEGDSRRAPILDAVRLAAGTHRLETRLAGYRTDRRTVDVPGGGAVEVQVRLEREGGPAVAENVPRPPPVEARPPVEPQPPVVAATVVQPPPPPTGTEPTTPSPGSELQPPPNDLTPPPPDEIEPPAPADSSSGVVFTMPTIIAGAASGALLITAIVTGVMASGANAEFEDLRALLSDPLLDPADDPRIRASALDKADQANSLALATDVIGAIGIIGLGVTAYLFISDQGASSDRALAARAPRLGMAPTFSRDGAGLALHGSF